MLIIIISFGSRRRGRLAGFLSVLSLLGVGLAGIAAIVCFRCATAGMRPHSRVSSSSSSLPLLTAAAIACFQRTTAGTRPCVGKHSVRAFHSSAHARPISALRLSAMDRCLAFACCDNLVFVGRRPTARRIKNSVLIEVFWFGRIASAIHLRISLRFSLQMASGLQKNFFGAG